MRGKSPSSKVCQVEIVLLFLSLKLGRLYLDGEVTKPFAREPDKKAQHQIV